MFRILCKSIHSFTTTSEPHKFNILRLQQFSSSNATKIVNQDSFSVQYLINEFGFSPEKAVVASKNQKLHFQNRDKPDAVVSFFRNQGFTETQIKKVIAAHSSILISQPEKIFLPKIDFFRSKGFSSADLAKMVALNHQLLTRSLDNYIIPTFNSLGDFIGSDEDVICMLRRDSRLFNNGGNRVKSNIEILRGAGVPPSSIASLLKNGIRLFCYCPDILKESIEQVQKMGMDPLSSSYSLALLNLVVTPRSRLNEKMEAYKRWGCSEEEVLDTFKIQPSIMCLSVEKINAGMSFFVNEIGWEPSMVVRRRYFLLMLSLKKRIMPRWAVYQELVSKGLVKEEGELSKMFEIKDDLFIKKYVNCHENEAPLLLKLYREKLEASK